MAKVRVYRLTPVSRPTRTRGVPYAVPEDMALSGDTRDDLHYKPLPRRAGPHYTDDDVTLTTCGSGSYASDGDDGEGS